MIIYKKKKDNSPYNGPQNENHTKRKFRKVLGLCLRTKKTVEHEGDYPNRDYPNYGIYEIGKNTEKSPGDLKHQFKTIN